MVRCKRYMRQNQNLPVFRSCGYGSVKDPVYLFFGHSVKDFVIFDGVASSFRIIVKVREMDQSIRSVAESLCLVYTLTKTRAIFY